MPDCCRFIIIALTHPELSFPWSNRVSFTIYVLYAVYTILVFIMPRFKGASLAACGILAVQFIALSFIVLSIGWRFKTGETNWYLPIGLGLTCAANFAGIALRKRKGRTK